MAQPPMKRVRLVGPSLSDPSVPLPDNCSPFLTASDDVLNQIFYRMNDRKAKMRLELVCDRFRSRIKQTSCWILDKDLYLSYSAGTQSFRIHKSQVFHLLDGSTQWRELMWEFNNEKAPQALAALLERMYIEHVRFNDFQCGQDLSFKLFTTIADHKDSFQLETISFSGIVDASAAVLANVFLACNLNHLEKLYYEYFESVADVEGKDFVFTESFVSSFSSLIALTSPSLKQVDIQIRSQLPRASEVIIRILPVINKCQRLETLTFGVEIDGGGLAAVCNNLPCLKFLELLAPLGPNGISYTECFSQMNEEIRGKIEKFRVCLEPENEDHRELSKNICNYFPNLKQLNIHSSNVDQYFNNAMEMIESVLANFGGRGKYEFDLGLHSHPPTLSQMMDANGPTFVIKNNSFKCVKDDLVITIDCQWISYD